MCVGIAVLIGHLWVSVPVPAIIKVVTGMGFTMGLVAQSMLPEFGRYLLWVVLGSLTVGSAVAWIWWSLMVPRWRKWALQLGAPPDKLQKWAVLTGLVWPKGWIFEKTEVKLDQ
jgi:hypothetical protein